MTGPVGGLPDHRPSGGTGNPGPPPRPPGSGSASTDPPAVRVGPVARWLGWVLLVVVVAFVVIALDRNWTAVRSDLALLTWADLTGSSLAAAAAILLTGLSWRLVLTGLGGRAPFGEAMRVYLAGQLGKYVPGSVWVLAVQAELGRRRNIPRSVMAVSYLVSIMLAVATGGLVGLLALLSGHAGRYGAWAPVIAVVGALVAVVAVRPGLLNRVIGWIGQRTGRELPAIAIPGPTMAGAIGLMLGAWALFGLHAWLLARPLGAGADLLLPTTGAFALAFVAGLLLVPLPAGAGVREAVLVAILAGAIGTPSALVVSLLSRFVLVAVDVLLALAAGVRRPGPRRRSGPGPAA